MADPLTVTLEVKGLAELDAMLRAIPEEVAGPIMRAALTAAGDLVRAAAAANIHSRSGRTAADLQVQVQVHPEDASGVAAIGGTKKGSTARGWVLRFLEFGARGKKQGGKGWDIKGGSTDRRLASQAIRALRRSGNTAGATALRLSVSTGSVTTRHALKLPGNVFRNTVHHPGYAPQAPLTRALAESGAAAVESFRDVLWQRLTGTVSKLKGRTNF